MLEYDVPVLPTVSQERNILHAKKRKKANLRRNDLLQSVIEGKMEGRSHGKKKKKKKNKNNKKKKNKKKKKKKKKT